MSSSTDIGLTTKALLLEPWSLDVQVAVPGVLRNKTVYRGIPRENTVDNQTYSTRLLIYPITDQISDSNYALVVFESELIEPQPKALEKFESQSDNNGLKKLVTELSSELKVAKDNMQITVEELQTTTEELQSMNEELQSSNEELQTTNEELETSNEELQSTNEIRVSSVNSKQVLL